MLERKQVRRENCLLKVDIVTVKYNAFLRKICANRVVSKYCPWKPCNA